MIVCVVGLAIHLICLVCLLGPSTIAHTQVCTLMDYDVDYPTAGHRMPATPAKPTAPTTQLSESTQSTSAPLAQPTQQAYLFQQQLYGMADAARQQLPDLPTVRANTALSHLTLTTWNYASSESHTGAHRVNGTSR